VGVLAFRGSVRWEFAYHRPMGRPSPVLGALDPEARAPFGPHSIVRAVVGEPVTALLVQRALVMEVAHPKVAAAVAHHSTFERRPLTRAWVTADAALRLVFGNDEVARAAARQVYAVHDHINGTMPVGQPAATQPAAGRSADLDDAPRYTAHEATLLAWVWATLVDTAEVAYTRWVRPMSEPEADQFFAEMRAFGLFFGIPDAMLPADRGALTRSLEDMLADDEYGVSDDSRSLARRVLWFRRWNVPPPVVRLERVLALATLDPRLLERLGIEPDPADRTLGARVDDLLRSYYRHLPRAPRLVPTIYVGLRGPAIGLIERVRTLVR
jgi:uncharacterized protein (DUF2236 family)